MYSDILFVFDIDDTLVVPRDIEIREKETFMVFNPVCVKKQMFRFYENKIKNKNNVLLLTARHPNCKQDIANYFTIPRDKIICRDFSLDINDCKELIKSENRNNIFYYRMYLSKIDTLNKLSNDYDLVIFFDDFADKMNTFASNLKILNKNIIITLPISD